MNLLDNISKVYDQDPEEIIGRYITNAMGVQEIVTLKKIHWEYLEWLEEQGADVAQYMKKCEELNPDKPLSGALQCWVYQAYVSRERDGLPRPEWLQPLN